VGVTRLARPEPDAAPPSGWRQRSLLINAPSSSDEAGPILAGAGADSTAVYRAAAKLRELGLVEYRRGRIRRTPAGDRAARAILDEDERLMDAHTGRNTHTGRRGAQRDAR
jgi:hypothetical protein